MADSSAISLTLPKDLLERTAAAAVAEHRTVNDILTTAVEQYLRAQENHETLMLWGQEHGKQLGITSEEDVERLANEWRVEQRAHL